MPSRIKLLREYVDTYPLHSDKVLKSPEADIELHYSHLPRLHIFYAKYTLQAPVSFKASEVKLY